VKGVKAKQVFLENEITLFHKWIGLEDPDNVKIRCEYCGVGYMKWCRFRLKVVCKGERRDAVSGSKL